MFDCSYDVARARLQASGKRLDRFEREERAFFERVRGAYLARARSEPQRMRIIDGEASLKEIRRALEEGLAGI